MSGDETWATSSGVSFRSVATVHPPNVKAAAATSAQYDEALADEFGE
jgi:hypothetical protein